MNKNTKKWKLDEVSWAWEKSDVMEVNQEMSVGVKVLLKPKESISSCCCCYCGSSKLDLKCSFPEYSPVITICRVSLVSEIVSKLNEEKKTLQSLANSKFSSLDDQTGNFLKILKFLKVLIMKIPLTHQKFQQKKLQLGNC